MFVLYAVPLGIVAGLLLGGRLERLADVGFRWAPLAVGGLFAQLAIFSTPVGVLLGDVAPFAYVASTVVVLAAVLRNAALPGMRLVAAGAICNLVAILSNGGYMPADRGALALAGLSPADGVTNSILVTNPALGFLTDIFALPDWVPFANVFSIGDVLIAVGIARAIALGMARPQAAPDPVRPGTSPD